MSRLVVIVGSPHDPHVTAVAGAVTELGAESFILDALSFPDDVRLALGEGLGAISVEGRDLGRPSAAYLRDIYASPLSYGVDAGAEMDADWRRTLVAYREKANLLLGLLSRWSQLGVPVYNPRATEWLQTKPVQLAVLQEAGLPVPDTVWTNDPEAVRHFASGRRVIYKPVAGGAATRELSPEDLTEERLAKLAGAPVTFQELLPGDNYRVYCIDGDVVAVFRIVSTELDFRQNEEILEQAALPDEALDHCLRATEVLGLRWSGIDLRAAADGSLKFLEVNSSPMFLGFDSRGGTNILGALADRLAGHAS